MEKEIVWRFYNLFPNFISNQVTNINRYPPDYPGIGNFTKNQNSYDNGKYCRLFGLFDYI